MRTCFILIAIALLLAFPLSSSELSLKRFFSDDMILQRNKATLISGKASPGKVVELSFKNQQKRADVDVDGHWSVSLDPMPASHESSELKVNCEGESIAISNILVGDLFLVGRQSSVDISLGRKESGREASAQYPKNENCRVLILKNLSSHLPQDDISKASTKGWCVLDSRSALEMTGSTFFLAKELSQSTDVPVGIIDLQMGHQFPISWLSREVLEEERAQNSKSVVSGRLKWADKHVDVTYGGVEAPKKHRFLKRPEAHALFPAAGYNGSLHPLRGISLAAILLQLGNDYPHMAYAKIHESEFPFDREALREAYISTYDIRKTGYRLGPSTLPHLPRLWRRTFGDESMPFGLIAPPGSDMNTIGIHHREMRELQRKVCSAQPGVDQILPGMENIPFSAQPKDDALLGRRCFQWVEGALYKKQPALGAGPQFERMEAHFNEATVYFKSGTAEGLSAKGDALNYFEAAGVEGEYAPAMARIDGEVIHLESDSIPRIARVRYNWNHRPNEGLVNSSGLPALPFRSEEGKYLTHFVNEDSDLPNEYSTPANQWDSSGVTLINGQMEGIGFDNFTGVIGPVGIHTGPFGPNMGVREVYAGSPAEGKIRVDDIIYSANGKMLGDHSWQVMAEAITESETREGGGKLTLGLRRGTENIEVEIQLEVMGSYSPTAPYDCPKSDKILKNLNEWIWENGAGAGFLHFDAIYMLASGDPKLLARARQIARAIVEKGKLVYPIDPTKAGKSWGNSGQALFLAEYYFLTGDKTVLPHLKHACDRLAATQNKEYGGWRHNFPGGKNYGFIPNCALPGVMGMALAKKAGVQIDLDSYDLAIEHFSTGKAETGAMLYGSGFCRRSIPPEFDPQDLEEGHLSSWNGALSAAGILMGMVDNHRAAHLCSFMSSYAWNNTFHGHGGNMWNNFWTPLGSHSHGKKAYIHFWKKHRWYRELNRMYHGGLIMNEKKEPSAATGVALVAPLRRIQIVGAPPSPFAADAPECLAPALAAHEKGDYDLCQNLVKELIQSGSVVKNELKTVESLATSARLLQESLQYDEELGSLGVAKASLRGGKKSKKEVPIPEGEWDCLVAEIDSAKPDNKRARKTPFNIPEKASLWQMKVLEDMSQAPEGWFESGFDDRDWKSTHLPISWRMYHTALFRTTFEVSDPADYDKLRFHSYVFRQQGIKVYLNGKLICRINNVKKKTGHIGNDLEDSALKHLKKGKNTLAITTRHNWRWGMLFMTVYNDGFDFNLDARKAN